MPLPYQTILRLPPEEDAVAILEQEAERWLLTKLPASQRNDVRSGRYFTPGVHRLAPGKSLIVVHADRAEDGSRRRRLLLVEKNAHGRWEASITAVDYPAGNRRRDALIITASRTDDAQGEWVADPPRLVKSFLARTDVRDGLALVTATPRLAGRDDIDDVVASIEDRTRSVSVIIAASLGVEHDAEFRARVGQLTSGLIGVAAVYLVTQNAIDALNSRLGGAHSVEAGRIRTFLPLVDLADASDARRHRVLGPATFARAIEGNGVAEHLQKAFAYETRSALLSRALPSDLRRGVEALDAEQRRLEQERRIDERVRDRLVASTANAIESSDEEPTKKRTRKTLGRKAESSALAVRDNVLTKLASLARRWLGDEKPPSETMIDAIEHHIAQQAATTEEWVETAATLENERNAARALADTHRMERDDLDLELAIVEQDAETLRRRISFLQGRMIEAQLYADAYDEPELDPIWQTPQSLIELATILHADYEAPHTAFAHVEFTGDIRCVEEIHKRDPVGRYVAAFWEFVHTLNDYAERKRGGQFAGSVHQYLCDPIAGYKCSVQRHAATESESVISNAAWRAQRELPVPRSVDQSGRTLMLAHFKPTHADTVAPRMHYFDDTGGTGKVYIGYIGRHLDNTKTRSA